MSGSRTSGSVAEEYRRQLGTALRAARKERRPEIVTLQEWARQLTPPSSKDYISGVETGHHWPSRDFVERYEAACGIDTGELVDLYERLRDARQTSRVVPLPLATIVVPPGPKGRRWRGGLYAALAVVGMTAIVAAYRGREEPNVSFVSVRSGTTVCYGEAVDGHWKGLAKDTDLWLVVRPRGDPRYYPQPGPLVRSVSGHNRRWTGSAYFGEEARGVGEEFELEVVTATRSASAALMVQHLSHAGLAQLPGGATVRAAVSVTRNC